jgi:hypothetical protein
MDRRLLEAALSGDAAEMKQLALDDPGVLVITTPQGNTCLHIASIHGHEGFCKDVLALNQICFSAHRHQQRRGDAAADRRDAGP